MHRSNLTLAWLAAMLMTACAAPSSLERVTESRALLERVADCCSTLADAKRAPLPMEETRLPFDEKSQATRFDGKKAFFALFELPAFVRDYSIYITSLAQGMQGRQLGAEVTLLVPRVILYDHAFNITRTFGDDTLRNRGTNLERTIFINSENSTERYLSIHGSDLEGAVERSISVVNTTALSVGPGVNAYFHTGRDAKMIIRSSPTGVVSIEVRGLVPQKAVP
jgi:hypothetical protein